MEIKRFQIRKYIINYNITDKLNGYTCIDNLFQGNVNRYRYFYIRINQMIRRLISWIRFSI